MNLVLADSGSMLLPGFSPLEMASAAQQPRRAFALVVAAEQAGDVAAREALLDRAMGPRRRRKTSEKLRQGRLPAAGLAFAAKDGTGKVVGTVRLWDVTLGEAGRPALLLGPLAVDPEVKGLGIGAALMRRAIAAARTAGHGAVVLVGDEAYYGRFGFSARKTRMLSMPGPYEQHRLLALELTAGALDDAKGMLTATGRRVWLRGETRAA